jgi:hypothetical protein
MRVDSPVDADDYRPLLHRLGEYIKQRAPLLEKIHAKIHIPIPMPLRYSGRGRPSHEQFSYKVRMERKLLIDGGGLDIHVDLVYNTCHGRGG